MKKAFAVLFVLFTVAAVWAAAPSASGTTGINTLTEYYSAKTADTLVGTADTIWVLKNQPIPAGMSWCYGQPACTTPSGAGTVSTSTSTKFYYEVAAKNASGVVIGRISTDTMAYSAYGTPKQVWIPAGIGLVGSKYDFYITTNGTADSTFFKASSVYGKFYGMANKSATW